jgi:predicted glycoside hydrolase/deacetylase ChbG (UPF0249 family)
VSPRYLIVNADDFGRSSGVNAGIAQAHEQGIVTSTSMMVLWPGAAGAGSYANEHPELSVGLHLDLAEWVYAGGGWVALYERPTETDAQARAEVQRQLDEFRRLTGTDPTHLDSHQHVHRAEPLKSAVLAAGHELGVPIRLFAHQVQYCGDFYGQSDEGEPFDELLTVDALAAIMRALPSGYTELGCHPAREIDFETTYAEQRLLELETLCDPRLKTILDEMGVELRSFRDVTAAA